MQGKRRTEALDLQPAGSAEDRLSPPQWFPMCLVTGSLPCIRGNDVNTTVQVWSALSNCQAVALQNQAGFEAASTAWLEALHGLKQMDTNKYPPTPPSPHPVQPPPPSNPTNSDEDGWACDEDEGGGEAGKQLQPWARPTAIQAAASKRTAPSSFNKLPTCPPIEAGCVGAPFFRFIRPDASRLEAARQGKQGAAVYEVKQPEWREMSFAGGLPELLGAMQAWPSRRLMTQLPLGACIPMTQRQGGTSFQASSCWRVCLDASAATQLGVGGVGGAVRGEEVARALMQPVALWCAQWLGQGGGGQGRGNHADDGTATPDDHGKNDDDCVSSVNNHTHSSVGSQDGCRNSGCGAGGVDSGVSGITADVLRLLGPPGVWSQADVALRVWSHGACEPLRCDMSDQLVVQVSGCTRVVLVPPDCSLSSLSPFPTHHPYHGYSAPAVAATACPPQSQPHSGMSDTVDAVSQLWPGFARVRGRSRVLVPGEGLWVPAGWWVHLETAPRGLHGSDAAASATGISSPSAPSPFCAPSPSTQSHAAHRGATGHTGPNGVHSGRSPPCNAMLVVRLSAASAGAVPRSLGALELHAARMVEEWCARVTPKGSVTRVRELLLDLADRLDPPSVAPTTPAPPQPSSDTLSRGASEVGGLGEGRQGQREGRSGREVDVWGKDVAARSEGQAHHCIPSSLTAAGDDDNTIEGNIATSHHMTATPPTSAPPPPPCTNWAIPPSIKAPTNGCHTPCDECGLAVRDKAAGHLASLASLASHWLQLEGLRTLVGEGQQEAGKGGAGVVESALTAPQWPPTWDPSATATGHKQCWLAETIVDSLGPLATLLATTQQDTAVGGSLESHGVTDADIKNRNSRSAGIGNYSIMAAAAAATDGSSSASVGSSRRVWAEGGHVAALLRRVCQGRLLPTPWLNKLAHNDPLLLAGSSYTYTLEFKSDQEALFPELFAQQLSKREAGARRAARDAHIAAERLKLQQGRQAATQALPPTS